MKKIFLYQALCMSIMAYLCAGPLFGQQKPEQDACRKYSDAFDSFNPERWQEVLLYSRAKGVVTVKKGQMILKATTNEPTEIQVYSLFTFDGDFDIQADYDVSGHGGLKTCFFNMGMVTQTLGDERSYKCYVGFRPQKGIIFLSHLDRYGEDIVEKHKGSIAPQRGKIRIVRKDNFLSFLTLKDNKWSNVYNFKGLARLG